MSGGLKIIFAGTPGFAASSLQALLASSHQVIAVYTRPDRPAGRGQKLRPSPVKEIAQRADIPLYQPVRLGEDECDHLEELAADVMLVSAYGILLPAEALAAPRLGCVNVHASLLPRWRGAAPVQHAILAGDRQTGITIMQMVSELDAGPILHQLACTIHATDTAASLHDRLAHLSAQAIVGVMDGLQSNRFTPAPQDASRVTCAKKLAKQDAGIDWHESALEIERKIRAFNPWPVAHTHLNGQRLRIWQAVLHNGASPQAPGTIIATGREGIDVATGKGVLRLELLQLSGRKAVTAQDFINAHNVHGQRFESMQEAEKY